MRLEGMAPPLQIRSIYDHVLSVAHSADVFLDVSDFNIREHDRDDLARVIAYHDITEVILGDIPQYTKLNQAKRNRARVSAQIRLAQLPNGEPERIASEFIGMFLHDSERQSLQAANAAMQSKSSVAQFAYALDKIDPIIAVWRYIHHYRHLDRFDIDEYLLRMKNFFENPRVKQIVATTTNDSRMIDLVDHLQNRAYAREYFFNASLLQDGLFSFPQDVVGNLIEGRKLEFTVSPYRRSGRIAKRGGGGGISPASSAQP